MDLELYGVALLALTMLTATMVLLVRRRPAAELVALTVGVATVLGGAAVHVAPRRSFLSDSYSAAQADALSWAIIFLMMLTGLAMAVVGFLSVRRRPGGIIGDATK